MAVTLERWVQMLPDARQRASAWKALRDAGETGVAAARAGLAHPDWTVRAAACDFLDHCSLDAETTRLLVRALDDPSDRVRTGAAHALTCEFCKPDALPPADDLLPKLLDLLEHDPSPAVRRSAAATLGRHRSDAQVAAALERVHLGDPHTKVRMRAGWAVRRRACYVHQLHPPGEVRLFTIEEDSLRRTRGKALAYDVRVGDHGGLRHYSFPDRWYAVNVSLDLDGNPIEHGTDGFAYNCDLSTPLRRKGSRVYEVDLELDVLIRADGRTCEVVDRDRFEHACQAGWIAPAERDAALRGLDELLALISDRELHAYLQWVCAFRDIREAPVAGPFELLDPLLYPQLQPDVRPSARPHG